MASLALLRPVDCYSVREVARLGGIPHQRVSEAIKRGELDVIRIGRRTWIRDTDAAAWLASRRAK